MSYSLKRAKDLQSFREKSVVVIAFSTETNTPVGAAIVCRKDIDVFVRKSERNKGIGKELVNAVTKAVGGETELLWLLVLKRVVSSLKRHSCRKVIHKLLGLYKQTKSNDNEHTYW